MLVGWVQLLLDTRRMVNSQTCYLLLMSLGTVWPLLLAQVLVTLFRSVIMYNPSPTDDNVVCRVEKVSS